MAIDSVPSRLMQRGRQHPSDPALWTKDSSGAWRSTNWGDYAREVRTAARAMMALGFEKKDTVCILGFNRAEWVVFDVASMAAGGAPAGIYTTCSPTEVQYIIDHAESKLVLVENAAQWDKIAKERERLPRLQHVVFMKGAAVPNDPMCLSWQAFLDKATGTTEEALDERLAALEPDQTGTFIYTSGTTGPPKAVMLSHTNLTWTADCAKTLIDAQPNDVSLSYLPLSHIAEQMFSVHGPISHGIQIYFAESLDKVPDNLREVQPTVIFGVPRIWEKMHAKMFDAMSKATGAKAKILAFARGVGRRVSALAFTGQKPTGLLALQYKIANKLVFSKVKAMAGLTRTRICVSGAAPISAEVLEFFSQLDIRIHEVYGQSEGTGPSTFNRLGATKLGTVGQTIPGCTVKIGSDGEILVKGPNVFLGYYKDPAATSETLIDGWLHSGDLGEFDPDGFLKITGRKKEIIITAGGKNIAPKNIEASMKDFSEGLVTEAMVIGDRRKFLSAVVTIDPDKAKAVPGAGSGPAHDDPAVIAAVQRAITRTNEEYAQVEHVRKFRILPRAFTMENGELTPTLKLKRKVAAQNWSAEIEAMYAE